ncbi:MAG: asparagine synthase (glutamine-hydrolyzing) [Gemmatimonadota bacterium]|nr:asparagine synthase (glutamine-hydrolyzing) [Gemmatimonadota bacterium]
MARDWRPGLSMCGIAGVISPTPIDDGRLDRMSAALAHRGPDASGRWASDGVVLLHRRLSIIDPEHGQQPMSSADGALVVTFNGEIYNYPALRRELETDGRVFRTNCDTEVLLHLYDAHGPDFVSLLRGMFAFALFDRATGHLLLARDHIGQKPLFYSVRGDTFAFASEMKALLAAGLVEPRVDVDTLWHHTALRFCPDETTLVQGVRKLPPGHVLEVSKRDPVPRPRRYWRLSYANKLDAPYTEATDHLEALLDETVRMHLMSDVPLGGFLSGGVDSSLVAALAAPHVEGGMPTFTVAVEGSKFSELDHARRAAEVVGTRHHESRAAPDLMLLLPDIVWHMEQPVDAHAVGLYLLADAARRHVKVVLGGDGGDETFGGYLRFTRSRIVEAYRLVPRTVRRRLLSPIIDRIPAGIGYHDIARQARWAHETSLLDGARRHAFAMTYFGFRGPEREALFTPDAAARVTDGDTEGRIARHYDAVDSDDELDRTLYVEQMTRLPEHFLHISDRMTMAHGLEMRPPLVDPRLIEFAATLPSAFKIRPGELKLILREVAKRYFPQDLIDRPKMGFMFPMADWFRGDLTGFVDGVFADASLFDDGLFRRSYVEGLIEDHRSGRANYDLRIWNLLNLEVWHRLFARGESRDDVREWLSRSLHGLRTAGPA